MRALSIEEVIELHNRIIRQSGGSFGLRDRGALESSVRQPFQSFGGAELYPSLIEKAAALGYLLISNHPFVDGNKRVGHAAFEVMLLLNGFELTAALDEQENVITSIAAGELSREDFTVWVEAHAHRRAV